MLGCASGPGTPGAPENYGVRNGANWVRGPWEAIKPSRDVDDVIDQLCPAIMEMPRARGREMGQEYCGTIYSLGDGTYYASHPSPMSPEVVGSPDKQKHCTVPSSVVDSRGRSVSVADYHSHPWPHSAMSRPDMLAKNQRFFIRIQFDTSCHIMKLIPYLSEARSGEVYERQGKSWKLIGRINPEDKAAGIVTRVE
jgi:hypothetical protein